MQMNEGLKSILGGGNKQRKNKTNEQDYKKTRQIQQDK